MRFCKYSHAFVFINIYSCVFLQVYPCIRFDKYIFPCVFRSIVMHAFLQSIFYKYRFSMCLKLFKITSMYALSQECFHACLKARLPTPFHKLKSKPAFSEARPMHAVSFRTFSQPFSSLQARFRKNVRIHAPANRECDRKRRHTSHRTGHRASLRPFRWA